MDSLSYVIAARIQDTYEKVNEKFISLIADKYEIDPTELEELFEVICKEATKGKRKRKSKKKGVKKTTGFLLFSKEERIKIKTVREKAKLPELSFGDTSKEVGTRWRSLSDEEQAEYNLKAKEVNETRKQAWEKEKKNEAKPKKNEEKAKPKKNKKKTKKSEKVIDDDEITIESSSSIEEEDEYISESGEEDTPRTCIAILKTGKRRHEMCGKKVQDGAEYCKPHNK